MNCAPILSVKLFSHFGECPFSCLQQMVEVHWLAVRTNRCTPFSHPFKIRPPHRIDAARVYKVVPLIDFVTLKYC